MVNNRAPADPVGPGSASAVVLAVRDARRPSAVLDGRAWRHRRWGFLVVLRVERFIDPGGVDDSTRHRAVWQAEGEHALEETWRARWGERARVPGWIEARFEDPPGPETDLLRVEDHTGEGRDVTVYRHLTVWGARSVAMVTIRHDLGAAQNRVSDLVDRLASAARTGLAR